MESDTPYDPKSQEGAYEIMGFEILPNIRATELMYVAYL
jgi:hypothetical protein